MWHGADNLGRGKVFFWFARRIDFGDNDFIRILESTCKFKKESLRTRIGVRLPDCPEVSLGITSTCTLQRRHDLGGMMSIIIEDADAVHLPTQLEATSCACEFRECLGRFFTRQTQHINDRQSCKRITNIMLAWNLQ